MWNPTDELIISGIKSTLSHLPGMNFTIGDMPLGAYLFPPFALTIGGLTLNVIISSSPKLKEKLSEGSIYANILTFGGLGLAILILF